MSDDDQDAVRFTPEAQADFDRLAVEDPETAAVYRELFANMRQAAHAWKTGQYQSFEEAMEAISGKRPEPVSWDEIESGDETDEST